jgi:response regulator RpfG family c-di-GMP phosphodiesterase
MSETAVALAQPTFASGADRVAAAWPADWAVLCVDDEPNILASLRRALRGSGHRVLTAGSGAEALALCERESIGLVLSDMRMPVMDGAQLLQRVREGWPDVTRLLLTGHADIGATIAAINQGRIHRYITKPWSDHEIRLVVREAFERCVLEAEKRRLEALTQRQNEMLQAFNARLETKVALRTAELALANQRLDKNYFTAIKSFSNFMELRDRPLVGHSRAVADLARQLAQAMNLGEIDSEDAFIGGLLHDIGHISLPDCLTARPVTRMEPDELAIYRMHPLLGEQALLGWDDMRGVAALIRAHHESYDGRGFPDGLRGDAIPPGARILALADTYIDLQSGHLTAGALSPGEASGAISRRRGTQFDPKVVDAFLGLVGRPAARLVHRPVSL